jgi:L-histidine N-alpha-methyltransferase
MRLRARRAVDVRLAKADLLVSFEAGEELRTEISCKFTRESLEESLALGGLELERWMPGEPANGAPHGRFAVALVRRAR